MKWQLITDYNEQGLKYLNLGSIAGDFVNKSKSKYRELNEKKLGFNTTVTEYIGEFEIILNNFSFNLYQKMNKK